MASDPSSHRFRPSRRALLTHGAAATAAAAVAGVAGAQLGSSDAAATATTDTVVPFHGEHQAGIVTEQQSNVVLAAFDVTTDQSGLRRLLDDLTALGAALSTGRPAPAREGRAGLAADSGIATGLAAARFSLTVGFGPGLFGGRFGLTAKRPRKLDPLPAFPGDTLDESRSGGDLVVQLCADDPQVLSHAFLQVRAVTVGKARLRWSDAGFLSRPADGHAPRNLLGLQDGTANPPPGPGRDRLVWADTAAEPAWMHGGTYLVFRRIRLRLPEWSLTPVDQQDQAVGRRADGSPLSAAPGADPSTPLDLVARDAAGGPAIPARAHVRQMHRFKLHRRSYNYDRGFDLPAASTHGEDPDGHGHGHGHAGHSGYDAGLLFLSFLQDPARQFVPAQQVLATADDLNRFLQTTGSSLFAIPGGVRAGESLADGLV
ncbi:Dyp-type peroxidase family [Kribbella flavida DSM 17836]|uniref:Dyp-type peroxidase family n=1 Tax=Kribbella flavida (strain DSM 17836 / JCM 10339 / NBRC 14399) TaxID=479435 RepID=D2PRB7_KRIFD|nr:Dyp-type peroxidase [Kribbella flavida]ADB33065.1 Dyp-type peroxidase family [Kribbella flavida DSM 17836]